MSTTPTPMDAQLIMQLYDLRREAEMRKARNWWFGFWPDSADDVIKVAFTPGGNENNWFRQVLGYWNMAAAFVLQGALNEGLFMEPSVSGEMFIVFAKMHPFLKEIREKAQAPEFLAGPETLIMRSEQGRARLKGFEDRLPMFRKVMKEAAAAKAS